MTGIHPRHHVRRRRLHLESVSDRLASSFAFSEVIHREEQEAKLAALLPSLEPDQVDAIIDIAMANMPANRIRQSALLTAAQVSDELINITCKIAATRRLTQEDTTMLHYHATGGTTP